MIVLKSSRENIGQYEKAEAVVLFLCKECADHIRMLGLPEDFYEAVAYQIKTQGYGFTDKGSITSALMKTGSGFTRLIRERFHPFDFCRSRRRERVHAEPPARGGGQCSPGTAEM